MAATSLVATPSLQVCANLVHFQEHPIGTSIAPNLVTARTSQAVTCLGIVPDCY